MLRLRGFFLRRSTHGGVRRRRPLAVSRPSPPPRAQRVQAHDSSATTTMHRRFCAQAAQAAQAAQMPDDFELAHLPPHATISLPSTGRAQVKWAAGVGDAVAKGQTLCEEGGVEIVSPADGVLAWTVPQSGEAGGDGFAAVAPTAAGEHAPLAIVVPRPEDVAPFLWFSPCSDDTRELVYEGSFGALIRRVKMVSVASCSLTLLTMPMLALFGDASVAIEARLAIAGVVSLFGAGTTGTVNWICKPYIVRLWRNTQDHYTAETVNILAQRKLTNFVAADVTQGDNRPFSSFKLGSRGMNLYVHKDDECWRPDEHNEFFFTRPDA